MDEEKVPFWRQGLSAIKARLKLPTDPQKRRRTIIGATVVGVVVITAAVGLALQLNNIQLNSLSQLTSDGSEEDKLTGQLATSLLDGLEYESERAARRPIAVMVENHPAARPQFGLSRASVIYEAVAEGGITRYLLIFGPNDVDRVGPIRSARTYYIDWALEYDAIYAHAGGAANALAKLRGDSSINNLDSVGKPVMWRQRRGSEASEHTLYGSTVFMRRYAADLGWVTDRADFVSWPFSLDKRDVASRAAAAEIEEITIPYSGSYRVVYAYDAASNTFKRRLAGQPDIDALTDEQIAPTNIIVQYMTRAEISSAGKTVGDLNLYSGGRAIIFRNGQMIEGTWEKSGERQRTKYRNENQQEIILSAGQTIVTILQPGQEITFTAPVKEESSGN